MRHIYSFCIGVTCILLPLVDALSVIVRANLVEVETKHVLEHDNVTLVCNSTEPAVLSRYFWIRNDTDGTTSQLFAEGPVLEFLGISTDESGIYECRALDDTVGENVTVMAVKIEVETPDEPEDDDNLTIFIAVGGSVAGVCVILLFISSCTRKNKGSYRFAGTETFGHSMKSDSATSMKSYHGSRMRFHSMSSGKTFHDTSSRYGYHYGSYISHLDRDSLSHYGVHSHPLHSTGTMYNHGYTGKPPQDTDGNSHHGAQGPFGGDSKADYGSTLEGSHRGGNGNVYYVNVGKTDQSA